MADATAQAKQTVKESTEAKAKSVEEAQKLTSAKPTPTQEENDLAKMGVPIETHEDDGSGPEPGMPGNKQRQVEGKPSGGGYNTRSSGSGSGQQSGSGQSGAGAERAQPKS